jgi:competence protein ComEA
MSMDPAIPEWRAFGQPATPHPDAASTPPAAGPVRAAFDRLSRTTLITLGLAGAVAVAGVALGLSSIPSGSVDVLSVAEAAPGRGGADLVSAGAAGPLSGPAAVPDLVVDVAGAVVRPGLVRLAPGSRVGDAVAAAGGYAPRVDLAATAAALNLAAPVADGSKVLVPALGEGPAVVGAAGDTAALAAALDLNRATQAELEALPGIGPVTAGRILEARQQAPFTSVDELRGRGLVGESTFAKLRELVTVGG